MLGVQGNAQFAEKVAQWQRKLGTVDVVLNTWAEVQKKWANLESIFVGSADIRVQLPEDSKRFDAVNTDFQARGSPTRSRNLRLTARVLFKCKLRALHRPLSR